MNSSDRRRREVARLAGCTFYTFDAGKRRERRAVKNQIADGIFDAAVDAAAHLGVLRADPGVPSFALLNLASGKSGIGIQAKGFLHLVETKVADRVLSGDGCKREKEDRKSTRLN